MVCASSVPEVSCVHLASDESGVQSVGGVAVAGHRGVGEGAGA